MISIICVTNNLKMYHEFLEKSLKIQEYKDYEIILIDSLKQKFSSASDALNYGASISKGEYLVFCHQDICFSNEKFLNSLLDYCNNYDFGIAGVAGVEMNMKKEVFSNITMGPKFTDTSFKIDYIKQVASIDECMFIIKKEKFTELDSFNTWHFYAVDYSLKCYLAGEKVVVFPLELYHFSPGWSLNNSYYKALKKIAKKYGELKIIPTTVSKYKNNCFLGLSIFLRKLKNFIKR